MFYYYQVVHKCKSDNQDEIREIGVFSSKEKAFDAINAVKDKPGFIEHQDCFFTEKFFKIFKPHFLNYIFWSDGFDTYYFNRESNELCCDAERSLMSRFSFLLTEYNFKFDKLYLGNLVDEDGRLWFYGPYNCYYFYNDKVCINFMNLVQRGDWNVYITSEVLSDQNRIKKGKEVPSMLCYNWTLFASTIKNELTDHQSILGIRIN